MSTGLFKKIQLVMKEITHIEKDKTNEYHKYDYVSEETIVRAARASFLKHNLILLFSTTQRVREGDLTSVLVEFKLIDLDEGGIYEAKVWGEGQDKGDKGIYKAYTGALKYFLLKNFLIPTGEDDPEIPQETLTPKVMKEILETKEIPLDLDGDNYPTWNEMMLINPTVPKTNKDGSKTMVYKTGGISKGQLQWWHGEIKNLGSSTWQVQAQHCIPNNLPVDFTQWTWQQLNQVKKLTGVQ